MSEKLKTLGWYLKRPQLYPRLLGEARRIFFAREVSPLNRTAKQAAAWCSARAVDTSTALQQLTGTPPSASVESLFPEVFTGAHRRVAKCPVKMGGPGDLDLLYWLAEHCAAKKVLETGVACGWSSLALLLSLAHRPGSRLVSTDMPYPKLNNDRYVGQAVPEEFRFQWRLLRTADKQAIPRGLKELGALDLCHYDSDKSYEGRAWAYPLLWNALCPGGTFISDDIGDNVAFRDFVASTGLTPVVVAFQNKFVGVLVK